MAETVRLKSEHIHKVRYPPELLPFAATFTVPASSSVSPAILDLKKLNVRPLKTLVSLAYFAQPQNSSVKLVYSVDDVLDREEYTTVLPDHPAREEVYLPATEKLYFNYKNVTTSDVSNYYAYLGMWVHTPTVAEKILAKYYDVLSMDISEESKLDKMDLLTRDEKDLVVKYGLLKLLEKGTHPLLPSPDPLADLRFKLEREYQVIREEVRTNTVNLEAGQDTVLFDIKPSEEKGEIIVLTGVAPQAPSDPSYGTQIWIDRDEFGEFVRFDCYPLSNDFYIPMWIVGVTRMRVYAYTDTAISDWKCRIRYKVCRLNNILKARWFYEDFVSKHPDLEEFAERVRLGVW